jgi:tetratricopeptide (TPR) repeat protein
MNKISTASSILFCLLGLSGCETHAEYNAEGLFKQVSPSIVTILTFDEKGSQEGQGSGVVIGQGRIVTNCHVVREANSLKVNTGTQEYAAKWTQTDPSRDICVISAEGITAPAVDVRKLNEVKIGEPVFAVGNPLGFGLSVSSGLISSISPYRNEQVIVASISLSPGSSGGGLFDTRGRLLGITTAILSSGQNLNIVLPANWISELIKRGVNPPAPIKIPEPEPRWEKEAQALYNTGKFPELEKHARQWRDNQPSSALASAYLGAALGDSRPIDAEVLLRDAVRLDDKNEFTWYVLSGLLYRQGQKNEAEQALQRAIELSPNHGGIYLMRAGWSLSANNLKEAYTSIQEAIRQNPDVSTHWKWMGIITDKMGRPEESAKAYHTALRLNPLDEDLKQALSQVLARQGKTEAAHLALGKNSENNSSNAETWFAMGTGELTRKRYADAEKAFRKSITLFPENFPVWASLGTVLMETNRLKEAEQAYDKALTLKPDKPENLAALLTNRGNVKYKLGDQQAAFRDFQAALRVDADFIYALRSIGFLFRVARDYKEATEAFRKVVKSSTANADDWASLGESLVQLGEMKQALEALEKAEKLDADNQRVLVAMVGFHGRNGDQQKALNYIERSLKLDSSDAQSWSNKGYALLKLDRLPEAIGALETAVNLDPQYSNAWINLGEAQMRSNNLGKSIQSFEKAITLTPAAADARIYLTQCYLSTHQPEKARAHANALLKAQPDHPQAMAVLTLSYLMDSNAEAALNSYQKIQAKNPRAAKTVRSIAVSQGLAGAQALPE